MTVLLLPWCVLPMNVVVSFESTGQFVASSVFVTWLFCQRATRYLGLKSFTHLSCILDCIVKFGYHSHYTLVLTAGLPCAYFWSVHSHVVASEFDQVRALLRANVTVVEKSFRHASNSWISFDSVSLRGWDEMSVLSLKSNKNSDQARATYAQRGQCQ